jgi:MoxR-like ATPase
MRQVNGEDRTMETNNITGTWTGIGQFTTKGRGYRRLEVQRMTHDQTGETRTNTMMVPRNLDPFADKWGLERAVTFTLRRYSKHSSMIVTCKSLYGGSSESDGGTQQQGSTMTATATAPTTGDIVATLVNALASAATAAMRAEANRRKEMLDTFLRELAKAAKLALENEPKNDVSSLDRLLLYLTARDQDGHALNIMMVGPAGCGKSTIARMAANALDLPFYADSFNRDTPPWQLLGRPMPTPTGEFEYVPSQFVQAFENGGIYLADEMDAADANTLLSLNMALANGIMMIPRESKPQALRHKDFICIAAANTYGSGSRVYVGREELDEATLSRFVPLSIDYDEIYEKMILDKSSHGNEVRDFRNKIRKAINESNLRRVWSTRHLIQWIALRDAGIELSEAAIEYFKAWSVADRQAAAKVDVPFATQGLRQPGSTTGSTTSRSY